MYFTIQTGGNITHGFMISVSVQFSITTGKITEVMNTIM